MLEEMGISIYFNEYGFGKVRTLNDYEEYARIKFNTREVRQSCINGVEPNELLTDKFIKPINNKNQFLQYIKRPNEIRAKALSTKALFINYPKFSREYFKTSPDGRIERAFDNSQFYNLTRATGDWIDAQNYVDAVYEKGGKL